MAPPSKTGSRICSMAMPKLAPIPFSDLDPFNQIVETNESDNSRTSRSLRPEPQPASKAPSCRSGYAGSTGDDELRWIWILDQVS